MKYLSVCSGLGGAELAFTPLDWECVGVCEIDKSACAVLAARFPNIPNLGDFTKIGVEDVGSIDLLVGGTPCQDFSVAGLRAGMDGDRGQLTIEFARLAERLRPRWLVWENVPGVLSVDRGRAFGTFLRILGQFGYGFAYRILDAQYAGVPQRRRRVFVVGHLGDWRRAAAVLFERQSLSGHPAPRREKGQRVAGTIKGGSGERGWPDPSDGNGGGLVDVAGTLGGGSGERGWQHHDGAGAFVPIAHTLGTRNTKGTDERGDGSSNLQPVWPADVASTLDAHFGDKWGLEDQHINSGASHFVPTVVGTMACNTGPNGHDAGNFQSNQGVDSGYVIPVVEPIYIKGAAIGRKPEAGPQYGEVLTDGSSYTLNASETHGVLAFTQNSRDEVRVIGDDGEVSGSLSAEPGTHQTTYLAYRTNAAGQVDPQGDLSAALTSNTDPCTQILAFDTTQVTSKTNRSNPQVGDPCHTLAKGADAPAIAMLNMQGSKGNSVAQEDGPSFTLNAMHGHDVHAIVEPAVSFHTSGYGAQVDENISQTLQASDARLSNQVAGIIKSMQVRRLTPTECERLQGIPDGITKVTEKSSDGPRYRMIGNGFAVPCVAWIGKRIHMVEDIK